MSGEDNKKQESSTSVFLEEISRTDSPSRFGKLGQVALIPILAVITGLAIGAIIIILTSESVYAAFGNSFIGGIQEAFSVVYQAYWSLFTGAVGDPAKIRAALQSGDQELIRRAFNPFFDSLVTTTPYIFAGLAVALGFRTGLFNIGVEGQLYLGAVAATYIGYSFTSLPPILHIPLALLGGALGGAVWGFIPGWLKAKTGGHEVINTIMMNYIAIRFTEWLVKGPLKRPEAQNPISPVILESAQLPRLFGDPIRFHVGFFIALAIAWLVWWYLFRTKMGFDLRTVGANANAARYAGMNIVRSTVLAMSLSGALAGMTGANEIMGVNHFFVSSFSPGYGFDAIALALLGKNHPLGVVLSAFLFGFLRSGATSMQLNAGIPVDIISVLQALVLAFIAAPAIIRTIYRLKDPSEKEAALAATGAGD